MRLHVLMPAILTCCLSASLFGESSSASISRPSSHYSNAQVKQLQHDAHSSEQFRALALYFEQRQQSYREQSEQEKKEWERRAQNIVGVNAKYPRPVDSARNLYQYYAYEADRAGMLAAQYEHLAETVQAAMPSAETPRP